MSCHYNVDNITISSDIIVILSDVLYIYTGCASKICTIMLYALCIHCGPKKYSPQVYAIEMLNPDASCPNFVH